MDDAAADLRLACPVCPISFPPDAGSVFALHVLACTTPANAPPPAFRAIVVNGVATASSAAAAEQIRSCPLCHHVYARDTAEHAITFHEIECARVNQPIKQPAAAAAAVASDGDSSSRKRPRDPSSTRTNDTDSDIDMDEAAAVPPPLLYPPHCALCLSGGRALLHCSGACLRSFHAACVDSISAGSSAAPTDPSQSWCCAACVRGVHACAQCGFLGHTSNTLRQCSIPNCSTFLHTQQPCVPATGDGASIAEPLVCPRHVCQTCHAVETDMRASRSCTQCFHATHVACPSTTEATSSSSPAPSPAAAAAVIATSPAPTSLRRRVSTAEAAALDPQSPASPFTLCPAHALSSSSSSSFKPSPSASTALALRARLSLGDIVLLLECNNALLPATATAAAPTASNQWGIVLRVESLAIAVSSCNQLLSISLFSDGSVVQVASPYVLPLGWSANAFATPHAMLRECIKWHAVSELNVRNVEPQRAPMLTDAQRDAVLTASAAAFAARGARLGLTHVQLVSAARDGVVFWQTHVQEMKSLEKGTTTTTIPPFVWLDTRAAVTATTTSG